LADGQETLRDWILTQDAVHIDETGWRTVGDSRALWGIEHPASVDL
jgi:hypothetical protein